LRGGGKKTREGKKIAKGRPKRKLDAEYQRRR